MPEPVLPHLISILQEQEIFEIYLPFLLTFSIFFALMEKMNIFGEGSRKINAVIAGIIAAYIMIFSPAAITISQFFSTFFAEASVGLVTLLVFMMIIGLLTGPFWSRDDISGIGTKVAPWAVGIGFLIVLGMFFHSGGLNLFSAIAPNVEIPISGEDLALIFLVLVTIGVIILLVSGGKRDTTLEKFLKSLK